MVRLGRFGEHEDFALQTGVLVTGWDGLELKGANSKNEIFSILENRYKDVKNGTLLNWSAQLNQFKNKASPNDIVVTPLKTTGKLAIGRLIDAYFDADDGRPARKVQWINLELPRDALKQDLLYSLGASQTICEVSRNNAADRFDAIIKNNIDPGFHTLNKVDISVLNDGDVEELDGLVDLDEISRDQIEKHISTNFTGHEFTRLIGSILEAEGFKVRLSPPGPDKGIDIVAGQGNLGLDSPRLVVQVKSGDIVSDQQTLQALIGSIQDTQAEQALLVSWSGFTKPVIQRTNELFFRVRLWDRKAILDALFASYDKLPEDIKAELPLRKIWTLVLTEDQ
jgi:restriction system protein